MHHVEQVLERLLRQAEFGCVMVRLSNRREFLGRQRLQRKAGFPALHRHALVRQRQRHFLIRQSPQNVEQLTCGHRRGCRLFARADRRMGADLDFNIGRQQGKFVAFLANEDIGQNRQRVPTLDNTAHDLQRPQQRISVRFYQLHGVVLSQNSFKCKFAA